MKNATIAIISVLISVSIAGASHAWPLCSSKKGTSCTFGDVRKENQYKCAAGKNGKKGTKCLRCEVNAAGDTFVWSGPYKCDSSLPVINKSDDSDSTDAATDLLDFDLDISELME